MNLIPLFAALALVFLKWAFIWQVLAAPTSPALKARQTARNEFEKASGLKAGLFFLLFVLALDAFALAVGVHLSTFGGVSCA